MQPFITYREENDKGVLCYYILQKSFPHYVGVIVSIPDFDALVNAPLPECNLYVSYGGCLHGNVVPSYSNSDAERDAIFYAMAEWYYWNRVKKEPKKYEKFKINASITTKQSNSIG